MMMYKIKLLLNFYTCAYHQVLLLQICIRLLMGSLHNSWNLKILKVCALLLGLITLQ